MATATVSQALKFLMSEGMTADEVIAATGISEATLYRSLRLSAETSPTPEAFS
jgi:predicted DNA-binding transcriptional regulator AlpA